MAGCEAGRKLRVAVLVSGGVDSSVALQLVRAAGHEVVAFYLQIWFQEDFRNFWDACPWEEDLGYARQVRGGGDGGGGNRAAAAYISSRGKGFCICVRLVAAVGATQLSPANHTANTKTLLQVCESAGVDLEVVPMTDAYWERVVSHSVAEIKAGRTPNPDMLCNSR